MQKIQTQTADIATKTKNCSFNNIVLHYISFRLVHFPTQHI